VPSGLRLLSHNAGEALTDTATPSLVVVGDRDRITPPRFSEALAEILPDATLVVLPGCGHQVMLERREELAALLTTFEAELTGDRQEPGRSTGRAPASRATMGSGRSPDKL
jgi:pimeloyl-ACP methyl ester carboxylesterase